MLAVIGFLVKVHEKLDICVKVFHGTKIAIELAD